MIENIQQITGKFTFIRFRNDTNFYKVCSFLIHDESEKTITVTGILPEIELDVLYTIAGKYVEHPRYGMQFAVETFEKQLPDSREGIIRYLSSVQFSHVGKKTAEKIVDLLGLDCISMIRNEPDILYTIPGLSDKAIVSIQNNIQEKDGMEQLVQFLNVHGIGIRNLVRLNAAFGNQALQKLKENPYRVIEECDGMGFKTADKIGQALGIEKGDHRRLYACLIDLLNNLTMELGDSYVTCDELRAMWNKNSPKYMDEFDDLLDEAVMHSSIHIEDDRIYPMAQFNAEVTIANTLRCFPGQEMELCDMDLMHEYLKSMETEIGITYDELQVKAIESFFQQPVSIITGGPGTGKTTVVRAFMKLFHKMYPNASAVCAAPTGRAAKRLCEVTGTQSTTIHSLLKWDLETNTFGKNETDPLDVDLLIIDECSMVDAYVFSALMKASTNIRKICLIGDEDQLPSVGPGCILRDLIASGRFPLVRLNHIYRQKDGSEVITLAHAIRNGTVRSADYHSDVHFVPCRNEVIKDAILQIAGKALQEGYSIDEIQVLSPMYRGAAGIDVLNNALQAAFNPADPSKREVQSGYRVFREKDKILQLKNQPDDDVYNGDIGILEEVTLPQETEDKRHALFVNYQDNIVCYRPENFDKITHAYCISVHKSQGGEYPIIIMPFVRAHTIMLYRKLIYTACSRARKSVWLVGDMNAFLSGIQIEERHVRRTTLQHRLIHGSCHVHALEEDDFPF